MRQVATGSADQSIRVWAYDSSGAAITGETYNSAGIAVSVVVSSAGRILSTTALTLVARSGAGVHTDSAFTEVGAGEYVVDLPDSYSATANRQVYVTLTSTAISGGYVLSETLDVQAAPASETTLSALSGKLAGITLLKNWLALIMGKAADNTTKTEVNATTAGATYDQTTDSLEAQKDVGGAGDASQATLLEVLSLVSSATITTTGYARLDANGVLLLKRGDTSAITFTSTTSNVVPDTSDSTTKVFFGVRDAAGRNFVTIEGTKLVNTGLQSYRFSPTAAQAKLIPKGKHYFDVMVMYGYTAGTAPAEGKPGTPATYTSLRTFVSGRCDVDDLMIEPSEVY